MPDSKAKSLYVKSAYIQKNNSKNADRLLNMQDLSSHQARSLRPKLPGDSNSTVVTDSISESNEQNMGNAVNNQKTMPSDTSYPLSDLPAHTVEIGKNTKTGQTIYVLKLKDRVSTEDYKAIAGSVKERTGGYYSRYAGSFIVLKEVYDGYRAMQDAQPNLHIGDIIRYNESEWRVIDAGFRTELKKVDPNAPEASFTYVGGMANFKRNYDYELVQEYESTSDHEYNEWENWDAPKKAKEKESPAPDETSDVSANRPKTESPQEEETTSEIKTEDTPDPDEIDSTSFSSTELFKVGDTVYLDNTAFEVINVNRYNVELRDPTLSYPISRAESKKRLMQLMQNDERNRSIIDRMETLNNFQKEESDSIVSSDADKRSAMVAGVVVEHLHKGKRITSKELFQLADQAFDGFMANGDYTVKDAYDALELGVNRYILSLPTEDVTLESMEQLMSLLPTQSKRTEEQENYQQFSTPPTLAYLAAYAANICSNDVLLEPSAGIGGLAVFGKLYGAEVHVNELDTRRLAGPYKFGT